MNRQMSRPPMFAVTAILLFILALISGCSQQNNGEMKNSGRPIPVRTVGLERGNLPYELELTGEIIAPERAQIAPTIGGRINRIDVRLGDRVKRGQVLVQLDTTLLAAKYAEAKAGLAAAEAAVLRAKAENDNAATEFKRIKTLAKKGFVTQQELDTTRTKAEGAQASYISAQAQRDQAQAQMGSAAAQISETAMFAPFDGMVERRLLDPGNVVSAGTPILAITRTNPATLRFSIPERNIGAVGEAMRSAATVVELQVDAFPKEIFTGTIARIAPVLTADSRARMVEAEFINDDNRLLPGMYGRLRLQLGLAENVLLLPLVALVENSAGKEDNGATDSIGKVYVVRDGTAKLTEVRIGHRRGDRGEVLGGLAETDQIIVEGQHLLRDDAKVQTTDEATAIAKKAPAVNSEEQHQ